MVTSGAFVAPVDAACTVNASDAECLRLPEVPVKTMVYVAAAALDAAVKVTLCAVPGVSVSVAGEAATPEGRPVIATETVLLKELMAVARTLTLEPLLPVVSVSDVGVTAIEKSATGAAAETVRAKGAEWLSVPEVPVKTIVALPATALVLAVSVILCAVPGTSVSVTGEAVTPEGRPVIATETVPLKELIAVARTLS